CRACAASRSGRRGRYGKNVEWMEKVSDEQYRRWSSVIRTITITALFHPARHWRRRHARRLGSDSLGRRRRRSRGGGLIARRSFENDIEIADPHRLLVHHGSQGSGELIDFTRSDTASALPNR